MYFLTYYFLNNRNDSIQAGYANLPPVSSPAYFELLRAWLNRCNKDHKCKGTISNKLPTRVIDIGQERNDPLILRYSKDIDACSYVALSHCWGEYQHGEKESICTHEGNLKSREVGFKAQELPKTF